MAPKHVQFADSSLEGAGFEPSVPQSNRSFGDNPNRPPGPLLLYEKSVRSVRIPFAPAESPRLADSYRQAIGFRRGATEQGGLLVGGIPGGDPLERIPQHLITAGALVDREIALEH